MIDFILAALFGISALFHAFALQWPGISVAESPETHLLFVLVNLWFVEEIAERQSWSFARMSRLYVALGALTIHQVVVHGYLLYQDIVAKQIPAQNVGVLLGLAAAWVLLRVSSR